MDGDGVSSEWLSNERLVEELGASEERVLSLEAENVELRASLRKSISGSALGREFEVLSVDREKLARLIEQLKVEKTHLVESVLLLSTEVEEANRLRQDDQFKFKQEVLRHAENERAVRAGKYRMGMQVVELLRIRGLDNSIRQDVNAYVANSCASSLNFGMAGHGERDFNALGDSSMSPESPRSHSVDDGEGRWKQTASPTNNSVGRSSNSARDKDGRKRRHFRRRRSEVLPRDETDSIISSVSTHRSGATSKNGGSSKYLGNKKSHTPITAETLAMLDKQNSSGGRMSPAKQEPEVQGPNWWGF